ncbi:MAG TPA: hypothetical protein VMU71_04500 [Terracidiphilus sp.]|nr:hypothetical protein [Terracidiphilus sp.]
MLFWAYENSRFVADVAGELKSYATARGNSCWDGESIQQWPHELDCCNIPVEGAGNPARASTAANGFQQPRPEAGKWPTD